MRSSECTRRRWIAATAGALAAAVVPRASAFGLDGAFQVRLLSVGGSKPSPERIAGAAQWSWELVRRTSAPARSAGSVVRASEEQLLEEPFLLWSGERAPAPLTAPELRNLRAFLRLGGLLVIDDEAPERGEFVRGARRELAQVLPESAPLVLPPTHVVYKSFYIVDRPVGRAVGEPRVEGVLRGRNAQVLLLKHDLLGALARNGTAWAYDDLEGGFRQREHAIRFAVNIAMHLLCSDYKDDQVHAPWLMRRRGPAR